MLYHIDYMGWITSVTNVRKASKKKKKCKEEIKGPFSHVLGFSLPWFLGRGFCVHCSSSKHNRKEEHRGVSNVKQPVNRS